MTKNDRSGKAAKNAVLLCGTAMLLALGAVPAGVDGFSVKAAFAASHGGSDNGGGGNSDNGGGGNSGSGGNGGGGNQSSGSGQQGAGGQNDRDAGAAAGPTEGTGSRASDGDSGRPEGKGGRPEGVGGGDEDSDRPDFAGTPGGSADRGTPPDAGGGGDLYGDLYVILRDEQGVPILNEDGFVQPIDSEGNVIPLDEEGAILPEYADLAQEVDFGRLSVSRAPDDVLEGRSEEVLLALNSATEVSLDPAGRLVVTIDGETSTIDAPLENLSIYIALMTDGYIDGVTNDAISDSDLAFLVDGEQTEEDMLAAATFLAAATDKTGEFSTDEIAYLNLILDIEPATIPDSEVNYSAVSYTDFTYDRASTYDGVTTTILVEDDDGNWVPTEIDVYEFVFADTPDEATDGTLEAFTQAAEDSRIVINYIHEYAIPVSLEDL